jgi:hypothetical protein
MAELRVTGIVKLADMVRRQLAGPISPDALDRLRQRVREGLEQLELVMADHGLGPEAMSPPSRKAYRFLKGVDFAAVTTCQGPAGADQHVPGTVFLPGLRGFSQTCMDRLAATTEGPGLEDLYQVLRDRGRALEEMLAEESVGLGHLKDESRALRAWLAYFAVREHFEAYVAGVARARSALDCRLAGSAKFRGPALRGSRNRSV